GWNRVRGVSGQGTVRVKVGCCTAAVVEVYPVTDSYRPITYRGSDKVKTTYSVVPSPRISFPVTQVKITEGFNPKRILTLCEVFIFGGVSVSVTVSTRPAVLSTVEVVRQAVPLATLDWFVVENVKLEGTDLDANIPVVSPVEVTTILVTILMEPVFRDVTQATQEDSVKIPVALHVVGRTTLVTRLMEPVHRDVTQATQGDSVKIPVALHVVGRTTLVTRLMEPVHRDVTQATQGDSVKIPVALHVVGRTTLVTRLMEPVHRDVTQATQGDFVSQRVLTGRMV
ncbi:hypothetical protein RRG08_000537, partial [Elysia crispata]